MSFLLLFLPCALYLEPFALVSPKPGPLGPDSLLSNIYSSVPHNTLCGSSLTARLRTCLPS